MHSSKEKIVSDDKREIAYQKLKALILKRQEEEREMLQRLQDQHEREQSPYFRFPTTYDFPDMQGKTLLHYAAELGDMSKIEECLQAGANINLQDQNVFDKYKGNNNNAIALALMNDNLEVAKYLHQNGARCDNVNLRICKSKATREWFTKLAKQALDEAFPNPDAGMYFRPVMQNQFFNQTSGEFAALERAVEIGDIDFIEKRLKAEEDPRFFYARLEGNPPPGEGAKFQNSLIAIAAMNGQLEMVKYLISINASLNPKFAYQTSALIAAIRFNHQEIIDYLLTLPIDINAKNNELHTALTYAIIKNNTQTVKKLLDMGAETTHVDYRGDTILHLAVRNNYKALDELLNDKDHPEIKALHEVKNYFDDTPLDLMKRKTKKPLPSIEQNHLLIAMRYRMRLLRRSLELFEQPGYCDGYAFLRSFYRARRRDNYFFHTVESFAEWNGEKDDLFIPFPKVSPEKKAEELTDLDKFYLRLAEVGHGNLDQLLEQWTNDLIWFHQESTLSRIFGLAQYEKEALYDMIANRHVTADKSDFEQEVFYQERRKSIEGQLIYIRNMEQITEMLSYMMRMPNNVHCFVGGSGHATSLYKDDQGLCFYYDSNFSQRIKSPCDIARLAILIKNFKFIVYDIYGNGNFECYIKFNYYKKDFAELDLSQFHIFSENEYPRSKADAEDFQKNSPNHFTHLHIAMMTRSIASIKRLLADQHYDINAKDAFGRTAFQIASINNFTQGLDLLLDSGALNYDDTACQLFQHFVSLEQQNEVTERVKQIIVHPKSNNLNRIFNLALSRNNATLTYAIISHGKINFNQPSFDQQLPLMRMIKTKETGIVQLMLKNGASLMSVDPKSQSTPLKEAIQTYSSSLIPYLKDVNQRDEHGYSALHYAVLFADEKAIHDLLKAGATVSQSDEFAGEEIVDRLHDYALKATLAFKAMQEKEAEDDDENKEAMEEQEEPERNPNINSGEDNVDSFEAMNFDQPIHDDDDVDSWNAEQMKLDSVSGEFDTLDTAIQTESEKNQIQDQDQSTPMKLTVFKNSKNTAQLNLNDVQASLKSVVDSLDPTEAQDKNLLIDLLSKFLKISDKSNEFYKIILDRCDNTLLESKNFNDHVLLHELIFNNQFDKIKMLLDKGVNIDAPLSNGDTPLLGILNAPKNYMPQVIKAAYINLFLKYQPNLDIQDQRTGKTLRELITNFQNQEQQQTQSITTRPKV